MSDFLFNEFDEVSAAAWKQKIQVDLKGADYNETLITQTPEGIAIKPFYHKDTTKVSASLTNNITWKIAQRLPVSDAQATNTEIKILLNKGLESLYLVCMSPSLNIEVLFKDITLQTIPIVMELQFLDVDFANKVSNYAKTHSLAISLVLDPIGKLAKTGNWHDTLQSDFKTLKTILSTTSLTETIGINSDVYQNAGANMVQQLAYTLAHANEYLNQLDNLGNSKITFQVAVGGHYFFEIAKLKALRLLWKALASEYNINKQCKIVAFPSKRNKTIYDYNVNMLRTTTECMSAVLGSADIIYNMPYDVLYHKENEFGDRISRNQLRILKDESYFDKVNNPTEGAYFIEHISNELAEKALALFKDIEKNGGFLKQLKEGTIQRKIKESATKEQKEFNEGKLVLLGTNKHPNVNDKMKNNLEISPFLKKEARKTLIAPIVAKRLAEPLEKERLANE